MSPSVDFKGRRVLIVEDEVMVAMLIEDMLTDLGCVVAGSATTLEDAMRLATDAEFDCALVDINLQGQPIFPLVDLLRAKGMPFAFATGYGDEELRGVDRETPILRKPFREDDLARVLALLPAP